MGYDFWRFPIFKRKSVTNKSEDDIIPEPTVHTDISGGHLALFLKIEDYVEIVKDFMGN